MDLASGSKISPVRILYTVSAADVSPAPGMTVKQQSEQIQSMSKTARRAVDGHFLPLNRLFRPLGTGSRPGRLQLVYCLRLSSKSCRRLLQVEIAFLLIGARNNND